VVLTATNHGLTGELGKKDEALWLSLQKDLLTLSSRSSHVLVKSGHYIRREHPEIVVKAVQQIIAATSSNGS